MREILFRAKDCTNQKWAYGWYFYTPEFTLSQHNIMNDKDWMNVKTVIPETVGQYTGLKDKNGKKIFEGDILLTNLHCIAKVVWDESAWCIIGNGWKTSDCISDYDERKFEVIGNIFDNPELLESDIHKVKTAESE